MSTRICSLVLLFVFWMGSCVGATGPSSLVLENSEATQLPELSPDLEGLILRKCPRLQAQIEGILPQMTTFAVVDCPLVRFTPSVSGSAPDFLTKFYLQDLPLVTQLPRLPLSVTDFTLSNLPQLTDTQEGWPKEMKTLYLEKCPLTRLDLSAFSHLEYVYVESCEHLGTLITPEATQDPELRSVVWIRLEGCPVRSLDLRAYKKLKSLKLQNCLELEEVLLPEASKKRRIPCLADCSFINCPKLGLPASLARNTPHLTFGSTTGEAPVSLDFTEFKQLRKLECIGFSCEGLKLPNKVQELVFKQLPDARGLEAVSSMRDTLESLELDFQKYTPKQPIGLDFKDYKTLFTLSLKNTAYKGLIFSPDLVRLELPDLVDAEDLADIDDLNDKSFFGFVVSGRSDFAKAYGVDPTDRVFRMYNTPMLKKSPILPDVIAYQQRLKQGERPVFTTQSGEQPYEKIFLCGKDIDALPSLPKDLRSLSVLGCPNLKIDTLSSQDLPQHLDCLRLQNLPNVAQLPLLPACVDDFHLEELPQLQGAQVRWPTRIKKFHISECQKVEKIDLGRIAGLKDVLIADCSGLKTLDTATVDAASDLKTLKSVSLKNIPVERLDLRAYTRLREIELSNCPELNEVLLPDNLETLKVFKLSGCSQLSFPKNIPFNIEALSWQSSPSQRPDSLDVTRFPQLKELCLAGFGCEGLKLPSTITMLALEGLPHAQGLEPVDSVAPQLQYLSIQLNTPVQEVPFSLDFSASQSLAEFHLQGVPYAGLRLPPHLESLSLADMEKTRDLALISDLPESLFMFTVPIQSEFTAHYTTYLHKGSVFTFYLDPLDAGSNSSKDLFYLKLYQKELKQGFTPAFNPLDED